MEDSVVSEQLVVQSHKGPYFVYFDEDIFEGLSRSISAGTHFIVDARVAEFYQKELAAVLRAPSVLLVQALESNKSLERSPAYVEHLVTRGVRRGHVLVGIGGGIIQDIVCFLATVLLRGLDWCFYPTTLLAQADSCIGSKSSINVGKFKNIVGTFTPPSKIFVSTQVLATLDPRDLRSGIGEMLKVHIIHGPEAFNQIAADYHLLFSDQAVLRRYIRKSLEIKKAIIEQDEFDRGIRNVMNYGHSFGHAIESATDFAIPHGIAITLGMDMANFIAIQLGRLSHENFIRMHPALALNYQGFEKTPIPLNNFLAAISRDKKNTGTKLSLILPNAAAKPERVECSNDTAFQKSCAEYFEKIRCDLGPSPAK
jgi:3-dehydroquinate synthase